jgi:hypothetical protein
MHYPGNACYGSDRFSPATTWNRLAASAAVSARRLNSAAHGPWRAEIGVPPHDFSTGAYQSLDFYLQPNGQPLADFGVLLTDPSDGTISEYVLSAANNLGTTANGFDHISVPMSALNPANQPVATIQIKNELNQNLATIHLDDVTLSD